MKRTVFNRIKQLICIAGMLAVAHGITAEDWPQWRGPDRTDISHEKNLKTSWRSGEPKRVWLFDNAGQGYSGPAIAGGKLFIMGTRGQSEILLALDAITGKELWTANIGPIYDNSWGGGPRGTPTVDGDRVYTMGGQGNLICARVTDGQVLWRRTMREFGGEAPNWGYCESVLVDGEKLVCTPGGSRGALVALNKINGQPIWQSKEFTDPAQYASIIPAEIHGVPQYIQLTMHHVVGIAANDGKLLWKSDFPGRTAVIPTPVYRNGHVYVTAGYGAGCQLIRIDHGQRPVEVYSNHTMKNHHGGVVLFGDHLYGYSDGVGWTCQDFKTGREIWSERRQLGKGAVTCAGGMLYCLDENNGDVALVEASPNGWRERGRFRLEPQSANRSSRGKIWTHPVVSNGKLYLRDQEFIYCYDVSANERVAATQ